MIKFDRKRNRKIIIILEIETKTGKSKKNTSFLLPQKPPPRKKKKKKKNNKSGA